MRRCSSAVMPTSDQNPCVRVCLDPAMEASWGRRDLEALNDACWCAFRWWGQLSHTVPTNDQLTCLPNFLQMWEAPQRAIEMFSEVESATDTFRAGSRTDARRTNRKNTTERPTFNPAHAEHTRTPRNAEVTRQGWRVPRPTGIPGGQPLTCNEQTNSRTVHGSDADSWQELRLDFDACMNADNRTNDVKLTDTYNYNWSSEETKTALLEGTQITYTDQHD